MSVAQRSLAVTRSRSWASKIPSPRAQATRHEANASSTVSGDTKSKSPSGRSSVRYSIGGSSPATCPSNQLRATSVLWHTSPISDIVDGGAERAQSCSGVNPSHFICNVAR